MSYDPSIGSNRSASSEEKNEQSLSSNDRKKFKDAFDSEFSELLELNDVIEDALTSRDAASSIPSTATASSNTTSSTTANPSEDDASPTQSNRLYMQDQQRAQIQRETLRKGYINNDPTGKQKKAAGDD